MKTLQNGLTKGQTIGGVAVIALLAFCAYIWASQPTANASTDVKTLQESVEQAQADYDFAQKQTIDSLIRYCESWKLLALDKANLAEAMKITTNINREDVMAVDCADLTIPSSF